MKKTVIVLMLLTILSKVLGFTRDIILSYFYGASNISDVYLISLTIPTVILAIIGKGITTGFIPMYTRIEEDGGFGKAINFTNNVVSVVMVLCTLILALGLMFTEPIVRLFASGFDGETMDLAISFTRITLIGVYFSGLIYVLTAYLQIKGSFIFSAIIVLPTNMILIGTIFFSSKVNIYFLSFGSLLSVGLQFFLLMIFVYKNNFKYRWKLDVKDSNIRRMIVLALPAILGSSVAQINLLVDRTVASHIAVGGISALNYANTINLIVMGVLVSSITTVLYPKISKMAASHNIDGVKGYLSSAIGVINLFVLPATIGYMIFAEPIVQLLYGRGEFDSQAISMTSTALFYYSIGLVAKSLRDLLSNVFYSFQDTKTPMINASIAMVMNIALNLVLSRYLGVGGLALASSISIIFCTFLLFINLRRKIGNFGIKAISSSFIKIFLASLIMGGISKLTYEFLIQYFNLMISLVSSIFLGGIVYFGLIFLMKIKEAHSFILEIKKKSMKTSKEHEAS